MPTLGELLRERRLEHRWTLEDVAQRTRIHGTYLEALEQGNYSVLPADVQVRGFLRNYALVLGLSPEEMLLLYRKERGDPELASIAPISRPPRTRSFVLPSLGFFLLAVLVMAAITWVIYSGWINPGTPSPTASIPPATPTRILPTPTPTVQLILPTATPTSTVAPTPATYQGLEAVFQASADCWVRVVADGKEIFEGTLRRGTQRTFKATRELLVRMGNAGGIRVTLNGKDLGVQGRLGQVLTQTWQVPQP